jgi:hypothetical protein
MGQRWIRLPRVPVESLGSEVVGERERPALIVDLSECGLRLERPLRGRADGRIIQLEFELPDADEIVWAKGEICFDRLRPSASGEPLRSTGVRLVAAAARHMRMLRDFVVAAREARLPDDDPWPLAWASHWAG